MPGFDLRGRSPDGHVPVSQSGEGGAFTFVVVFAAHVDECAGAVAAFAQVEFVQVANDDIGSGVDEFVAVAVAVNAYNEPKFSSPPGLNT